MQIDGWVKAPRPGDKESSVETIVGGINEGAGLFNRAYRGFLTKNVVFETRGLPTVLRGRAPHGYPSCAHSTPRD